MGYMENLITSHTTSYSPAEVVLWEAEGKEMGFVCHMDETLHYPCYPLHQSSCSAHTEQSLSWPCVHGMP